MQIPPDRTRWGSFIILRDLSDARSRKVIEDAAADRSNAAGEEAKVGAFYRAFMDEAKIEALDAQPLQKETSPPSAPPRTREDIAPRH